MTTPTAYTFVDDCGLTTCGIHDRSGERATIVAALRDDTVIEFADGSTSHAYRRELKPALPTLVHCDAHNLRGMPIAHVQNGACITPRNALETATQ